MFHNHYIKRLQIFWVWTDRSTHGSNYLLPVHHILGGIDVTQNNGHPTFGYCFGFLDRSLCRKFRRERCSPNTVGHAREQTADRSHTKRVCGCGAGSLGLYCYEAR
jgi:hypothetical protein